MRLIDADKLIASLKPEESVWVGLVLAEQVANTETVKAIPIEWIKSKIDAILDSHPNGNEETEILCKLLYEWGTENEID